MDGTGYDDFIGSKITQVDKPNNCTILLSFKNRKERLRLYAEAGCCSESWFEEVTASLNSIIGKKLKEIIFEEKFDFLLPESNKQNSDKNHKVVIKFFDQLDFVIVLRNSSNGYYDGWLSLSTV